MQIQFTEFSALLPHFFGLLLVLFTGGALFLSMKCFDRLAARRQNRRPESPHKQTGEANFWPSLFQLDYTLRANKGLRAADSKPF